MTRRAIIVYATLLAAWVLILGWQTAEHLRVRRTARAGLMNRAKDISETLGIVVRSQRRWGGVIPKERLESTLKDLIKPGELEAIALLNAAGSIVAASGTNLEVEVKTVASKGEYWTGRTVALMNLIDLGTNVTHEAEESRPAIVLPGGDRPPRRDGAPRPPPGEFTPRPSTNSTGEARPPGPPFGRGGPGRRPFGRPFWMSEEEFRSLIEKQGVHSFILVMSTNPLRAITRQDLWLRSLITALAGFSVLAFGVAWRNLTRTAELELRLVRASELNSHLRQMNLAAAGLAHETRNPLNIIRGLAQIICKDDEAPTQVREKSREILEETDRVTAQLNEFINYSRPREVRPTAVSLNQVVGDVARALTHDLEEKCVRLRVPEHLPTIHADEQLFRQAIFNLLLNAVQAVERGGDIEVNCSGRDNGQGAVLEIRDNGPGVPAEQRSEIFKPYFTTHQKGTGLGLAVVRQIVLAHGWEIECLANEPRGANFRISHIKLAPAA